MSLSKRAIAVGLLLLASQGCFIDFKRPGGPHVVAGTRGPRVYQNNSQRRPGNGFGPKIVEDKRPPARLLARDGTSCTVPKKKYDETVLGEYVWCTWYDTDGP